jgi:hypothetical protein
MTLEQAEKRLDEIEQYWRDRYGDECGYEGVYLSDGVSMSPEWNAYCTGIMNKKQEKEFEMLLKIINPKIEEEEDDSKSTT